MALVEATGLTTDGSGTDASSYNTASVFLRPGRLYLAAIGSIKSGGASVPTISGVTTNQVRTQTIATDYRLTILSFVGNGSTGALTIAFGGTTQEACLWSISEFNNTSIKGTGGSTGIVQSAEDSGTSETGFSVTLAAFSDIKNATYSCVFKAASNNVLVGSGFTELGEAGSTNPTLRIQSQWKNTNDTTADGTFNGGGGDPMIAIAAEIKFGLKGGVLSSSEI